MPACARFPATLGGALALALAACPLPQPLPGAGKVDGGTLTPPRVLTSSVVPGTTLVRYDPACPGGAQFQLGATLVDENTEDTVVARWFVDYDSAGQPLYAVHREQTSPPPADPEQTARQLTPFSFRPGDFDGPSPRVHVVEVVISTGFLPVTSEPAPDGGLTNRLTLPGYETQLFRWVFDPAPGSDACGP
jgi:hypothetical protein